MPVEEGMPELPEPEPEPEPELEPEPVDEAMELPEPVEVAEAPPRPGAALVMPALLKTALGVAVSLVLPGYENGRRTNLSRKRRRRR